MPFREFATNREGYSILKTLWELYVHLVIFMWIWIANFSGNQWQLCTPCWTDCKECQSQISGKQFLTCTDYMLGAISPITWDNYSNSCRVFYFIYLNFFFCFALGMCVFICRQMYVVFIVLLVLICSHFDLPSEQLFKQPAETVRSMKQTCTSGTNSYTYSFLSWFCS